uniref:glutathione transferase n=1 Tax=Anopheles quadriannulatus TaxID=34691 RepID=A0A182XUP8_ANOQN
MATNPIIKLYTAKLSPPGRAVELTAKLLGLSLDIVPINLLAGDHRTDEFLRLNPQHTIPVIDDGGVIVRDSHAIIIYLVQKYGKDGQTLYPEDPIARAKVNAGLHFDSGVLFSRLRFYFEPILYEGSAEVPQDKIDYMKKGYELLNDALVEDYIAGSSITLADVSCIATIATMEEFFPMDRSRYPALVAWIDRLSRTLPDYDQLNQEGAVEFAEICESLRLKNGAAVAAK